MNIGLTLIGQSITFIVFVWFCMKFIWPPLKDMMRERQEAIAAGLSAAEEADKKLAEAATDAEAELAKAKEEAAGIIEQARQRAVRVLDDGAALRHHLAHLRVARHNLAFATLLRDMYR